MSISRLWTLAGTCLLAACSSNGSNPDGGGNPDAGGNPGGQLCSFDGDACTSANVCCNGITTVVGSGLCDCSPKLGNSCYGNSGETVPSGTNCCNTIGGYASTGTVGTQCGGGSYPVNCSTDSNCTVGHKCVSGYCCAQTSCLCATLLSFVNQGESCCTGLILGTPPGYTQSVCLLTSGSNCMGNNECYSQHCVKGATTAKCQ